MTRVGFRVSGSARIRAVLASSYDGTTGAGRWGGDPSTETLFEFRRRSRPSGDEQIHVVKNELEILQLRKFREPPTLQWLGKHCHRRVDGEGSRAEKSLSTKALKLMMQLRCEKWHISGRMLASQDVR